MVKIIYTIFLVTLIKANVISISSQKELNKMVKSDNIMVKFYAPWCGHCKALAPEYIKAADELKKKKYEVKMVEIDCTSKKGKDVCQKYNVRGYPTLKYFKVGNSDPHDYEGSRDKDGFVNFIDNMLSDAITHVEHEDHLNDLVKRHKFVVVQYASTSSKLFSQIAEKHRMKFKFVKISDEKIAKKHNQNLEDIVIHRDFDDSKVHYSDDSLKLIEWIEHHSLPILGELDGNNFKDYYDRNIPLLWIAVDKKDKKSMKKIESLKPVVKKALPKILSFYIDGVVYKSSIESMGFGKTLPNIMLIDKNEKYKFDDDITPENIEKFINDFLEKKLKVFYKSQEIPKKNKGYVYELVGKNFEEYVMDEEHDVLVEFYLDYCGHCKEFAPEYKKFAKLYKDKKRLRVAKIDGGKNDTPHEIEGYPTVMLFRAGQKGNPLKYNGKRKSEDLEKWVLKNSPLMNKELKKSKQTFDKEKIEL